MDLSTAARTVALAATARFANIYTPRYNALDVISRYTLPKMREIWSEENKFRKWLQVELAACEAWHRLGKIPLSALRVIKRKANFSLKRIEAIEKQVDHDVIAFLTSVAERVGPESRYIHLGLTSSDVVDTAGNLLLREAGQIILADLKDLLRSLRRKAKLHKDTPMIGRTHGIHAEPTTLGLKFLVYADETENNMRRMDHALAEISVGKFSGAVGTYSNLEPKVEEIACKILRLRPAPISTQIIQRDRHATYFSTLAIIAGTVEQIALEIRSLQQTEVGELEEPFKQNQKGSSAMPHKRNPVTCERLCGLARLVRGYAVTAFENIALWHERDITHSSTERVIFPDATTLIDYMLQTLTRLIDNLAVYPEAMKRNLDLTGGLIYSQRFLIELVERGAQREDAYRWVQGAAMKAKFSGRSFRELIEEEPNIKRYLNPSEIEELFDLNYFLRNIPTIYRRMGISS